MNAVAHPIETAARAARLEANVRVAVAHLQQAIQEARRADLPAVRASLHRADLALHRALNEGGRAA